MRVSNEAIESATYDSDWYFYFRLCFSFWKDAYRCYRSFRLIAQASLAAALVFGARRGDDASAMMEEISRVREHQVASDDGTWTYRMTCVGPQGKPKRAH